MNWDRILAEIDNTIKHHDKRISELEAETRSLRHDLNNSRAAVSMLLQLMKERGDGKTKSILPSVQGDGTQA